jgi:hypothetical protein
MSVAWVDASSAECIVLVYKEGLLSTVAHDLKIRVTDFELTWDGGTLTGRFDPRSLRVVNAMRNGREDRDALGDDDKAKIEENIVADVLDARRHRSIGFQSSEVVREGDAYRVSGDLCLHGVTHRITTRVTRQRDRWTTQVSIHQPDYDIRPFKAMLGTLKVKPEVRVRLSVGADDVPDVSD